MRLLLDDALSRHAAFQMRHKAKAIIVSVVVIGAAHVLFLLVRHDDDDTPFLLATTNEQRLHKSQKEKEPHCQSILRSLNRLMEYGLLLSLGVYQLI